MATPPSKARWDKLHVIRVAVSLNRDLEPDLVARVEREENKSAYIKRLIREDVERERQRVDYSYAPVYVSSRREEANVINVKVKEIPVESKTIKLEIKPTQ